METVRYRIEIRGIVQGVGFRPFVYHLAEAMGLSGHVHNDSRGVYIEIQGSEQSCALFLHKLQTEAPVVSHIEQIFYTEISPKNEAGFQISYSSGQGNQTLISPDLGVCADCLKDIQNPNNRRFHYPFTNCTNCGPRFTIVRDMPYDRDNTTMQIFPLCPQCQREYQNPIDRRFHAQPNACWICGPNVQLQYQHNVNYDDKAVMVARELLTNGGILAIKGVGGYHLACDARNEGAVSRLRQKKCRWEKPMAIMCQTVQQAEAFCWLDEEERQLLTSRRKPIVLLRKKTAYAEQIAPNICGNAPRVGVMLPYTPLHYLLLEDGFPLVMTSGNFADEPILYTDKEAIQTLAPMTEGILWHNREILRRCDDSVVRIFHGDVQFLRRSRGYVPEPLPLPHNAFPILACGGEQKNTFTLTRGENAFISQHLGDLTNPEACDQYQQGIEDFIDLFACQPQVIAYDMHPRYRATQYAKEHFPDRLLLPIQHHHAHLASVLAEYQEQDKAIGLIYDGTGYGTDNTLWGGEVLVGDLAAFHRKASLYPLHLLGGEKAIRHPWRLALWVLKEAFAGDVSYAEALGLAKPGWQTLLQMADKEIVSPLSSGMGRLFDAVAALLGIRHDTTYEGQAATELEDILLDQPESTPAYHFTLQEGDILRLDWRPVICAMVKDLQNGVSPAVISAGFHQSVVEVSVRICQRIRTEEGLNKVVLSGGCWQNFWLLQHTVAELEKNGFQVMINRKVPCNDGGLSYGQAAIAAEKIKRGEANVSSDSRQDCGN